MDELAGDISELFCIARSPPNPHSSMAIKMKPKAGLITEQGEWTILRLSNVNYFGLIQVFESDFHHGGELEL